MFSFFFFNFFSIIWALGNIKEQCILFWLFVLDTGGSSKS